MKDLDGLICLLSSMKDCILIVTLTENIESRSSQIALKKKENDFWWRSIQSITKVMKTL